LFYYFCGKGRHFLANFQTFSQFSLTFCYFLITFCRFCLILLVFLVVFEPISVKNERLEMLKRTAKPLKMGKISAYF